MRTNSITGGDTLTYPTSLSYTRSPQAYIRYHNYNNSANLTAKLEIMIGGTVVATLHRKTDSKGYAVFPIGSVLESYAKSTDQAYLCDVIMRLYVGDVRKTSVTLELVFVGSSERSYEEFSDAGARFNSLGPVAPKIALYTNIADDQYLFVPCKDDESVEFEIEGDKSAALFYHTGAPLVAIDNSWIEAQPDGDGVAAIYIYGDSANGRLEQAFFIDRCDKGVFLRWTDKFGIIYHYRWSSGVTTDEMEVAETYIHLNDILQPYEEHNKTITRRYELHSRLIDAGLMAMCKSIGGAQKIEMLDNGGWKRVYLDDFKYEDNGKILQNLTVEVIAKEYNV